MGGDGFEWPWEYTFPPFFTVQPNTKTQEQQLLIWTKLVLDYQKSIKQAVLTINDETALFCNDDLKRKLPLEGRLLVLNQLQKQGNALPLDDKKQRWEVYWYPLAEWGRLVYQYICDNGLNNTVCTIYELINGDETATEEFHGLDQAVFIRILKTLQAERKCEVFDDEEGVKFF